MYFTITCLVQNVRISNSNPYVNILYGLTLYCVFHATILVVCTWARADLKVISHPKIVTFYYSYTNIYASSKVTYLYDICIDDLGASCFITVIIFQCLQ